MSADPHTSPNAASEAPPAQPPAAAGGPSDVFAEHPEALAGAAFVGGLLTALIVRRLGR